MYTTHQMSFMKEFMLRSQIKILMDLSYSQIEAEENIKKKKSLVFFLKDRIDSKSIHLIRFMWLLMSANKRF